MSKAKRANHNNCKVCRSSARSEIDRELLAQEIARAPFRELEKRYGLTYSSLYRHYMRHLGKKREAVSRAEEQRLAAECSEIAHRNLLSTGRLLDELALSLNASRKAMTVALESKNDRAFVGAVGLVQKNVALLATLSSTVQFALGPQAPDDREAKRREYVLAIRRALGCEPYPGEEPARNTAKQEADTLPAGVDQSMVVEATIVRPGGASITSPDGKQAEIPQRALPPAEPAPNVLGVVNRSFFDWKKL